MAWLTAQQQHRGKTLNEISTENSHIGHSTLTAGSANVKIQNVYCVK
jgi:hypothetical protein